MSVKGSAATAGMSSDWREASQKAPCFDFVMICGDGVSGHNDSVKQKGVNKGGQVRAHGGTEQACTYTHTHSSFLPFFHWSENPG